MSKLLAGRYELTEKIGEGGMAVVYKAKDRLLNRYVAIKILRPEFTKDEQFVSNFKRESQAAAGLQHPNIVSVYDVGKAGSINYIVMELIDGRPLSDIIEEQAPLDYKLVIDISQQICAALAHAHKNGIIHRDVKPHNIMITTDGIAKLTDFGIARAVTNSTIVADTSKIIGSVHYFSPEQARGSFVDERSDIYSLGIVMYEMLTGQVPFDGDNPVEVALKHINEDIIPPTKLNKSVPPNLEKLVMKATDKFQTNRYKSAEEMLEDLKNIDFFTTFVTTGVTSSGMGGSRNVSTGVRTDRSKSSELAGLASNGRKESRTASDDGDDGNKGGHGGGRHDNKKKILIACAIALGAILLLLVVLKLTGAIGGDKGTDEVAVPDLTGMTYEEAEAKLKELGLVIAKGEDISSADIEQGRVVSQMPVKDTNVKKGKTITVRLSSGPGEIEVPDLTNMTFDEAKAALEALGLKIINGGETFSETIEKGKIANQSPKALEMAKNGEAVTVYISAGPEEKEGLVPNLVGSAYTGRDAMDVILGEFGFVLGDVNEEESDETPGTIIRQDPVGGSPAEKGSYINIVIAKARSTVTVPSLISYTVDEARTLLANLGLAIEVNYVDSATGVPGQIIGQSPTGGTEVAPGTTIYVDVIKDYSGGDDGGGEGGGEGDDGGEGDGGGEGGDGGSVG
ncbi:MAG: Stk1 family PASTA domain-containing Ser/Thr kinase [Clostridia bacterium]|nr:Stk1 family PASTA domain-containing Ser/Thr kinase [Clostridia bacterium]